MGKVTQRITDLMAAARGQRSGLYVGFDAEFYKMLWAVPVIPSLGHYEAVFDLSGYGLTIADRIVSAWSDILGPYAFVQVVFTATDGQGRFVIQNFDVGDIGGDDVDISMMVAKNINPTLIPIPGP